MKRKKCAKKQIIRIISACSAAVLVTALPCGRFGQSMMPVSVQAEELSAEQFPFLQYTINNDWDRSYVEIISCDTDYLGNLVIPEYIDNARVERIRSGAFRGCNNLTGVDIPKSVDIIEEKAFAECGSLNTVIIRNDRCFISDSNDTFSSDNRFCEDIPFTGTIYANNASAACEYADQHRFKFSSDIPELDMSAKSALPYLSYETDFDGVIITKCSVSAVGKLIIPQYIDDLPVLAIDGGAFEGCMEITEIEIPRTIRYIEPRTFYGCSGLRKIELPESVREVDQNAFTDCSMLETVIIRNGDCHIYDSYETICNRSGNDSFGSYLFFGTIYAYAGSLAEEYAQKNQYNFSTEFPEDIVYGESALPYLTYEENDYDVSITKCDPSASGKLIIPTQINGKYVGIIGSEAFMNCCNITEIEIPESVHYIDNRAFYGCTGLRKIDLHKRLHDISSQAFVGCLSLETVIIRNPECYINDSFIFSNNIMQSDITIYGDRDSSAQQYAEKYNLNFSTDIPERSHIAVDPLPYLKFESNSYETELVECDPDITGKIILPSIFNGSPVERIDDRIFKDCHNITSLTLPKYIRHIPIEMFENCDGLKEVVLPEELNSIPERAFSNCIALEKINLPDSLDYIGSAAFSYCYSLREITIPEQVSTIYRDTFEACESLEKIVLPDNLTSIDSYAFSRCSSLESIDLPKNLKKLGNEAFSYCENLKTVEFPAGLTQITDYTFWYSGISEIVIPENILSVSKSAFNNCKDLREITFLNPYCDIYDSSETICNSSSNANETVFSGTIYGYNDSTAQKYAEKYGYAFESLGDAPEDVRGDANGDGKLSAADAVMLQKWLKGSGKLTAWKNVDLCKDGKIDILDMCMLRKELTTLE